jgi:hypothetical protein
MAFPALQYFSTLSHKRHDFRNTVTDYKICVLIFFTTFSWNISHSKKKWARYDQKCISVCMYSTGYSFTIWRELELSRQIFGKKNTQISNFMKIHPLGAELFNEDRRTDVTKLILAFRNFANASRKAKEDQVVYILRRNCLLSSVIEGKKKER